jgi:hypothetical protein
MGLSFALLDSPDLVTAVFRKLMSLYVTANRALAAMDCVGATRQGDDLGFKTGTFMPPDMLREHVFPIYAAMANEAHAQGKPFVLHSCGQLAEVYEDLIDCGIDAKHSFEDQITPVWEFQAQYGDRITPLGGLDVDTVCRSDEQSLRTYTRNVVEKCWGEGKYWALGTGNSLADYQPLENYTDSYVISAYYELSPHNNDMKKDFDRQKAIISNLTGMKKLWDHLNQNSLVARGEFCVSSKGFVASDAYVRAIKFGNKWGLEIGVFKEEKIFEHLGEEIPQAPVQSAQSKKRLKMV